MPSLALEIDRVTTFMLEKIKHKYKYRLSNRANALLVFF